ncbi:hypothetical protein C8J57DRAFT_1494922 [Mycena rebaudengoi]|nr:hypothetical protein C8J57DRAFT_1494922 [Mycena rebaudengoi]
MSPAHSTRCTHSHSRLPRRRTSTQTLRDGEHARMRPRRTRTTCHAPVASEPASRPSCPASSQPYRSHIGAGSRVHRFPFFFRPSPVGSTSPRHPTRAVCRHDYETPQDTDADTARGHVDDAARDQDPCARTHLHDLRRLLSPLSAPSTNRNPHAPSSNASSLPSPNGPPETPCSVGFDNTGLESTGTRPQDPPARAVDCAHLQSRRAAEEKPRASDDVQHPQALGHTQDTDNASTHADLPPQDQRRDSQARAPGSESPPYHHARAQQKKGARGVTARIAQFTPTYASSPKSWANFTDPFPLASLSSAPFSMQRD